MITAPGIMSDTSGTNMTVKKALSQSTLNILSLVTDPYHDFNLVTQGFPDGKSMYSCAQKHIGLTTISCPFTLATNETWGFVVHTTGLHQLTPMLPVGLGNGVIEAITTDAAVTLGPVNIIYTKYASNGNASQVIRRAMGPNPSAEAGRVMDRSRTVSLGFELINTTSLLDKSGDLTVFRMNSPDADWHGRYSLATTSAVPFSCQLLCNVPINIEVLAPLPSSHTWEAKEGAYCVALPPVDNHYSPMPGTAQLITNYFAFGGTVSGSGFLLPVNPHIDTVTPEVYTASKLNNVGLISSRYTDNKQTFNLNYRLVVETEPTGMSSLIPFASSSPPIDRAFLKMYEAMINQIRPGTEVRNNDSGLWFRRLLSIANTVLPLVAPLLPGPAKAIAMGATPIIAVADKHFNKKTSPAEEQGERNTSARFTHGKGGLK